MTQQKVFISYSSKNQEIADNICKQLENAGIKCWIAHRDESAGSHFGGEIVEAIEKCQLVVLIFSEYANSSMHIESEVALAFEYKKTIIPFIIDNTEINRKLKYALAATHKLKAYPDYTQKIMALLTAVSKQLGIETIHQNTKQNTSAFIDKNETIMLERADNELEEIEKALAIVSGDINKKINNLSDDLDCIFEDIIRRGSQQLEDAVDSSCRKMNDIVDSWGIFSSIKKLQGDIKRELDALASITLKRICDNINRDAKYRIKSTLDKFFSSAEDILMKLPIDFEFDQLEFVKSVAHHFSFSNDNSLVTISDDDSTNDFGFVDGLFAFFNEAYFGVFGGIANLLSHSAIADNAKTFISSIRNTFEATSYLEGISSEKDKIIDEVKKCFIDELLPPLHTKLEEIQQQASNKQKGL